MQNQLIFETERLIVRRLHENDRDGFFDMMRNPNVMNPIPREIMERSESDTYFEKHFNSNESSGTKVFAVESKINHQFIGLAAFLKNNNHEDEIGYRLREQAWGIGFGTEIAKGLLDYGFHQLNLELITADVNIDNEKSVKILDKFMLRGQEFFNPEDNCTDRRYKISRVEWMK